VYAAAGAISVSFFRETQWPSVVTRLSITGNNSIHSTNDVTYNAITCCYNQVYTQPLGFIDFLKLLTMWRFIKYVTYYENNFKFNKSCTMNQCWFDIYHKIAISCRCCKVVLFQYQFVIVVPILVLESFLLLLLF